jgi:hypothetical protein
MEDFMSYLNHSLRNTSRSLIAGLLFCASAGAQSHPFVSFDAPDATVGTFPVKINASGQIAGYYSGASGNRGFVRNPNGTITEFSAPTLSLCGNIQGVGLHRIPRFKPCFLLIHFSRLQSDSKQGDFNV